MRDTYNNGTKNRPVSASAVARIVIWSVVLCILSGVFAAAMLRDGLKDGWGSISLGWYDETNYKVGNGSTDTAIDEISIDDWIGGSVTLLPADGDEVVVSEDYDGSDPDCALRWKVDNGKLIVKYCKSNWRGVEAASKNLTISVPASMMAGLDKVNIETVSATQTVQISARELDLSSVSGRVTVEGDFGSVDVETVSGKFEFAGTFRECNVESVSGAADIRLLEQARSLDVDTVSGGVTLILPESTTGFRVDLDSTSGNTDIRGFSSESGFSNKWGDGSMTIEMESMSGSLRIEKETKD